MGAREAKNDFHGFGMCTKDLVTLHGLPCDCEDVSLQDTWRVRTNGVLGSSVSIYCNDVLENT